LTRPTEWIPWLAVLLDLCDMSPKGLPALDLAHVFYGQPTASTVNNR
jgi:hypothetical protein